MSASPGTSQTLPQHRGAMSNATPSRAKVSRPDMFLRSWLTNPLRMGSIIPSSPTFSRIVAKHSLPEPGEMVVELGAGTGVISRAMLDAGLAPDRLVVVEIDPVMADHLRHALPGVDVIAGDARELPRLLPEHARGRVGKVVCGIPLVLLKLAEQRRFIDAIEAVAPGRGFLHFSYCATSPLPYRKHGLTAERQAWTPWNFPPASLWRYAPTANA